MYVSRGWSPRSKNKTDPKETGVISVPNKERRRSKEKLLVE